MTDAITVVMHSCDPVYRPHGCALLAQHETLAPLTPVYGIFYNSTPGTIFLTTVLPPVPYFLLQCCPRYHISYYMVPPVPYFLQPN